MSDDVLIAVLGLVGTIVGGLLAKISIDLSRTKRDARAAKEQVQNSHETNFRDDVDELTKIVTGLATKVEGLEGKFTEHVRIAKHSDHRQDRMAGQIQTLIDLWGKRPD